MASETNSSWVGQGICPIVLCMCTCMGFVCVCVCVCVCVVHLLPLINEILFLLSLIRCPSPPKSNSVRISFPPPSPSPLSTHLQINLYCSSATMSHFQLQRSRGRHVTSSLAPRTLASEEAVTVSCAPTCRI